MIQAAVNVAAIHSNESRKKKQQHDKSSLYCASENADAISERSRKSQIPFARSRSFHHTVAPASQHQEDIEANETDASTDGGVNSSPIKPLQSGIRMRSDMHMDGNHEQPQHVQHDQSIQIIQDIIELDAFDDEELEAIPLQKFSQIEREIGKMDKKALRKQYANTTSALKSMSSMSKASQMSAMSGNAGNEMMHFDSWRDFLHQLALYLLSGDLIFPQHYFKRSWDKLVLLLLLYTAFEIPLHASFHVQFSATVDLLITCVFLFDLWLGFRTTYLDKDHEYVLDKAAVRRRYLKTWFTVDFIASMPVDEALMFMQVGRDIEVWFSLLRLLRLLKLFRIFSSFSSLSNVAASGILLLVFLVFSHWSACAFHVLGNVHPNEGWLMEDGLVDQTYFVRYVSAFYWAMSTITTIGYGDIHAITFDERLYSCFMVLVSAIVYSMLLATMSLILGEIYHSESEFMVHHNKCNKFAQQLQLDDNVQSRMQLINAFEKQHKYQSNIEYLMNSCKYPNSLRYSILRKTLKPVFAENYTFKLVPDHVLLALADTLSLMVSVPNEFLYKKRDVMNKVYFVQQGLVRVFNGKQGEPSNELCRLGQGAHFGEISFFKQDRDCVFNLHCNQNHTEFASSARLSTQSAVTHSFAVLYTCPYIEFKDVLLIDGTLYKLFQLIAQHRDKQRSAYDDQQLCQIVTQQFC